MLKTFWEGKRGTNACGNGKYSHSENEFVNIPPIWNGHVIAVTTAGVCSFSECKFPKEIKSYCFYHFNEMLKKRGRLTSEIRIATNKNLQEDATN